MLSAQYISLVPRCLSWQEHLGHFALAALMFGIASLLFIKGRTGKLKWKGVENPENHRRMSIGIAIYVGSMGIVAFLSTLFGWGC
jgi:hypothetical protein